MKKVLFAILALVMLFSLCAAAYAAEDGTTVRAETFRDGDEISYIYTTYDEAGKAVHRETVVLDRNGHEFFRQISEMDDEEKEKSVYIIRIDDDGNPTEQWEEFTDEGNVRFSDSKIVTTYPDGHQETEKSINRWTDDSYRSEKTHLKGENQVLYTREYEERKDVDGNVIKIEKYTYPDGTSKETSIVERVDGSLENRTTERDHAGNMTKFSLFETEKDGSYTTQTTNYTRYSSGNVAEKKEAVFVDSNGSTETLNFTIITDKNGEGHGSGIYRDENGRLTARVYVERRDDGPEGLVEATTKIFADKTVNMEYQVTMPDGTVTVRRQNNVKDYDGGEEGDSGEEAADTTTEIESTEENGFAVLTEKLLDAEGKEISASKTFVRKDGSTYGTEEVQYDEAGNVTSRIVLETAADGSITRTEETLNLLEDGTAEHLFTTTRYDGEDSYVRTETLIRDDASGDSLSKGTVTALDGTKLYDFESHVTTDENGTVAAVETRTTPDGVRSVYNNTAAPDGTEVNRYYESNADESVIRYGAETFEPTGAVKREATTAVRQSDGSYRLDSQETVQSPDGSKTELTWSMNLDAGSQNGFGWGVLRDENGNVIGDVAVERTTDGNETVDRRTYYIGDEVFTESTVSAAEDDIPGPEEMTEEDFDLQEDPFYWDDLLEELNEIEASDPDDSLDWEELFDDRAYVGSIYPAEEAYENPYSWDADVSDDSGWDDSGWDDGSD